MEFKDNTQFGLYELRRYAMAFVCYPRLVAERDDAVQSLYDDISPTIVGVDYDEGRMFSVSTNPETMAIRIIEARERYDTLIKKEEHKAELFEKAMNTLTDRELQVIQVYYFGRKNDLGLSDSYFLDTLVEAQQKLCNSLANARTKQIEDSKKRKKEELKRRIHAS